MITNEQGQRVLEWIDTYIRLQQLSNAELADLVTDHLWAHLPLGTPQSDLLAEVIERLKPTEDEKG